MSRLMFFLKVLGKKEKKGLMKEGSSADPVPPPIKPVREQKKRKRREQKFFFHVIKSRMLLLGNIVSLNRQIGVEFVHRLDRNHAKRRNDEQARVDGVTRFVEGSVAGLVDLKGRKILGKGSPVI